jgi:hypothetical protein
VLTVLMMIIIAGAVSSNVFLKPLAERLEEDLCTCCKMQNLKFRSITFFSFYKNIY